VHHVNRFRSGEAPRLIPLERNMLEAIRPSWRKLRVLLHLSFVGIVMLVMVRVLGYATITVVGWHEAVEAAADDTFAMLTGDVGDAGNRAAVLALGRVRGEGDHATTTCNMNVSSALFVKKKKKKKKNCRGACGSHSLAQQTCAVPCWAVTRPTGTCPRQDKRNLTKKMTVTHSSRDHAPS